MGVADRGGADSYNYSRFDEYVAGAVTWRMRRRSGHRRGPGSAGDFTLLRLGDGAQVRLSELWQARPLVMEFGSFT